MKNQSVKKHEIIILSRRDQRVFIKALLNPPAPSTKLPAAVQLYKQKMGACIVSNSEPRRDVIIPYGTLREHVSTF